MDARAAKRPDVEPTDDRISDLPDPILHHILSFYTIAFIAQMGTLSKHWSYIWRSCPNLDFSGINRGSWDFVQDVLWQCHRHSNVKLFRLIGGRVTVRWLNRCILHVVNHRVEELELEVDINSSDEFELPRCLLTCGTLKLLKLHFNLIDYLNGKINNHIFEYKVKAHALCLQSITSLSLQHLVFPPNSRFPKNKNDVFFELEVP